MSCVINALEGKWDLEHMYIICSAKTKLYVHNLEFVQLILFLYLQYFIIIGCSAPDFAKCLKMEIAVCKMQIVKKKSHVLSLTQCSTYLFVVFAPCGSSEVDVEMWCYQKPGFDSLLLTELQRQQQCSHFCDTMLRTRGIFKHLNLTFFIRILYRRLA